MNKKRVAIVFGGQSAEHEVSRVSAEEVIKNIDRDKYDVIMIGVTRLGKWLRYDGPETLLSGGQWQEIAETRLMNQAAKLPKFPKTPPGSCSGVPALKTVKSALTWYFR